MTISLDRPGASDAEIADAVANAASAAQDEGTLTVLTFAEGPAAVIAPVPGPDGSGAWHDHRWTILEAQPAPVTPGIVFGSKPVPRTAVAGSCTVCSVPVSWLIAGTWTLAQLTGY